jgi:hypothetical protein
MEHARFTIASRPPGESLAIGRDAWRDVLDPKGFGTQVRSDSEDCLVLLLGSADAEISFNAGIWHVDIVGDFPDDATEEFVSMVADQLQEATAIETAWTRLN